MSQYKSIRLLLVFWFAAVFGPCNAGGICRQTDSLSVDMQGFKIRELPNQRQLPVANVHRILQDSEGYLWYATEGGGLCRDDGYTVTVFRSDRDNPTLLASNDITCMTEDRYGRIWFGTKSGTYILDKNGYTVSRIEGNGLREARTNCMLTSSDGCVWIGAGSNVYVYSPDGSTYLLLRSERKGRSADVVSFAETPETGVLALQSEGGLVRFDATKGKLAEMAWEESLKPVFVAHDKKHGGIWVATWGQGIVKYDTNDGRCVVRRQPCTVGNGGEGGFRSQVLNILYDERHDILWAASMDDLYAYSVEGDSLRTLDTGSFLPEGKKILDHIIQDRDGNLWVPGYSPHTFVVYSEKHRLRRDGVKSMSDSVGYRVMVDRIVREDSRYYWIWQGRTLLSLYDACSGRMTFANRQACPAPLSTNKCIVKRAAGKGIWTCSGEHVYRMWNEGDHIMWQEEKEAGVGRWINALYDDGHGFLYIGTDSSLCRYDYKKKRSATLAGGVGNVRDIACASDGTVYFVADKAGLCRISHDNGQCESIKTKTEAHDVASFTALAVAPDGGVWTATSRGNVLHVPKGGQYLTEDSKAENACGDGVKDIVVDRYGHVWILADKYLCEYVPESGRVRTMHCDDADIDMDYFHTLGLEGDSVCLGGIGAFCMIASEPYSGNTPRIAVTSAGIDGRTVLGCVGRYAVEVGCHEHDVELFVSTFDYLHADSLQFAYRTGGEHEWKVLPKGCNRIVLHDLPYGTSELEVGLMDNEECRSGVQEQFVLYRHRPWFLSRVAYMVYLLIAAVAFRMLYVRRRKRRQAEEIGCEVSAEKAEVVQKAPQLQVHDTGVQDVVAVGEDADITVARLSKWDEEFIRRATEAVERNLDNAEYSVEQFSSNLCMSRMNLYRKLHALTGQKPSEFIRSIRLKTAAEMLREADYSVAELVDRVGFGTPRYFSKCFKDMYGVSPSQYRQNVVSGEQEQQI